AIRSALGCGRWRLARWLWVESLLLALAGGVLGILLARLGLVGMLQAMPDWMPRTDEIVVDGRVALAGLALALVTGLVFGAAPATAQARARIYSLLRQGSGTVGGRARGRSALVVAEVALAFVLVIAAGLAARSFWRAAQVDPGFEAQGVYTFSPMITDSKYEAAESRQAFFRQLRERLLAAPGVETVGAIHMLPIRTQGFNGHLEVAGREAAPGELPIVNWRVVSAGYFETLNIPEITGRLLDERDRAGALPTVLINQTFAEQHFPGQDPLGQRIRIDLEASDEWLTVVGVVGDIRQHGLTTRVLPEIYRPVEQVERQVGLSFLVRSSLGPSEMSRTVDAALAEIDPQVPAAFGETMASVLRQSLSFQRLILILAAVFAGLAMVLGAAGIYGVVAFDVSRRTPEIGLRMALGAHRGGVLRMILQQGLLPVAGGLVLGMGLSLALGRFVRSLLYEVEPGDPLTYAAMSLMLGLVAVGAVLVPAWRASRVDPLVALRHE
ncbi:MAG: FtsX-like permease family protein, partial [Acidobacteriota bacterium]